MSLLFIGGRCIRASSLRERGYRCLVGVVHRERPSFKGRVTYAGPSTRRCSLRGVLGRVEHQSMGDTGTRSRWCDVQSSIGL